MCQVYTLGRTLVLADSLALLHLACFSVLCTPSFVPIQFLHLVSPMPMTQSTIELRVEFFASRFPKFE